MTFTDKDIAIMEAGYDVGAAKLRALLARLKAGEELIPKPGEQNIEGFCYSCHQYPVHREDCKWYAWLKAAGK